MEHPPQERILLRRWWPMIERIMQSLFIQWYHGAEGSINNDIIEWKVMRCDDVPWTESDYDECDGEWMAKRIILQVDGTWWWDMVMIGFNIYFYGAKPHAKRNRCCDGWWRETMMWRWWWNIMRCDEVIIIRRGVTDNGWSVKMRW